MALRHVGRRAVPPAFGDMQTGMSPSIIRRWIKCERGTRVGTMNRNRKDSNFPACWLQFRAVGAGGSSRQLRVPGATRPGQDACPSQGHPHALGWGQGRQVSSPHEHSTQGTQGGARRPGGTDRRRPDGGPGRNRRLSTA